MSYKQLSPIPVVNGGTGLLTITAFNLIIGNGTGTPALVAPSATSGVPLISQGSASNPVFGTAVVAGGGTGRASLLVHSVLVGATTSAVTQLAVGTNGQVLIGANSADPAFATLTSTGGTITFTPGANSLNLESVSSPIVFAYTAVSSSPYTVLTTDDYLGVTSSSGSGAISILLPNAPATGRQFYVKDTSGNCTTYNITVTTVGGAVTIDGATSFVMNTNYEAVSLVFNGVSYEIY